MFNIKNIIYTHLHKKREVYLLAILLVPTFGASQQLTSVKRKSVASAISNHPQNSTLSFRIINTYNNTYSYDVFMNDKLFIHQPSIPALPGNNGFKTKQEATKVAELVINKIRKGEMPPTITIADLRKLKVIR